MLINTKYHGDIEYKKEDVINFKNGLPGFEHLCEFILFKVKDNEVFSILHSIKDEEIGIVVIDPFSFFNDYEFTLQDKTIKDLKIEDIKDVLILNTVTLNNNINNITTNLKAPIIINIKERIGEQIILNSDKYLIKQPLIREEV